MIGYVTLAVMVVSIVWMGVLVAKVPKAPSVPWGQVVAAGVLFGASVFAFALLMGVREYDRCEAVGGETVSGNCLKVVDGELRKVSRGPR